MSVAFRNVASYVTARGLEVETSAGPVTADVSYGGAFYASVRAADLDLAVTPDDVPHLVGDPTKMTSETGWTAARPLDQTLRDLVDAQAH